MASETEKPRLLSGRVSHYDPDQDPACFEGHDNFFEIRNEFLLKPTFYFSRPKAILQRHLQQFYHLFLEGFCLDPKNDTLALALLAK
jgi:hypothetical protein